MVTGKPSPVRAGVLTVMVQCWTLWVPGGPGSCSARMNLSDMTLVKGVGVRESAGAATAWSYRLVPQPNAQGHRAGRAHTCRHAPSLC